LVGAILGCLFLRWWLALLPVLGMAAYVFLAYPAATYVLVAGAALGTIWMTSRRRLLSQATSVAAMAAAVILILVVFDPSLVTGVTRQYYEQVGKTNNDHVRVAFDYEALNRLRERPLFGSFFTGEATVAVPRGTTIVVRGRVMEQLPPHNDFLQVGMLGGCFALVLLLGWLIGLNLAVIRWARLHWAEDRTLARLLLVIVNGFMATSLVEPVLTIASSALIFATSLIALKVCLSQAGGPNEHPDQYSLLRRPVPYEIGVSCREGGVARP
jgi:O-antigen ligase